MKKVLFIIIGALHFLGVEICQAYTDPWQAIKANDYQAAETLVRASLQEDPGHAPDRFLLARLLAWQKRYDEALKEYEVLLVRSPNHADYLLGKGQALYWQGSLAEALGVVEQAILSSPEYLELWILKIKILMGQGNSLQAHTLVDQAEELFSGANMEKIRQVMAGYQHSVPAFLARREMEVGFTYEYLSDDFDYWASSYVLAEWFYKPRATLYVQGRLTDRFSENDHELSLGTYQPLGTLTTYQLEANFSPSHEILAEYSFLAGLSRSIKKDWDVGVTGRHSIYTETSSNVLSLTGGHYFNNQRLAYTIYVSKVEGARETYSHRLHWNRYYGNRNYIGLYGATGEETENIGEVAGSTRFITSSVFGYGIAGRHWLKDGPFAISYQLWQHDQGDIYTRWGGALGFRIQF